MKAILFALLTLSANAFSSTDFVSVITCKGSRANSEYKFEIQRNLYKDLGQYKVTKDGKVLLSIKGDPKSSCIHSQLGLWGSTDDSSTGLSAFASSKCNGQSNALHVKLTDNGSNNMQGDVDVSLTKKKLFTVKVDCSVKKL